MECAMALVLYNQYLLVVEGPEGTCLPVAQLQEGEAFLDAACRRIRETVGIRRNDLVLGDELGETTREGCRTKIFLIKAYISGLGSGGTYTGRWVDLGSVSGQLSRKGDRQVVDAYYSRLYRERRGVREQKRPYSRYF